MNATMTTSDIERYAPTIESSKRVCPDCVVMGWSRLIRARKNGANDESFAPPT